MLKKSAVRLQNEREKAAIDLAETALRTWKENSDLEFARIEKLEALKGVLPPCKIRAVLSGLMHTH